MASFTFNVEKLKHTQIHQARHHNKREGTPASQLPKPAWITPQGIHEQLPWNAKRLETAHSLAKRKDAVEAISIVIQVGDQSLWREMPTAQNPEGKPRSTMPVDLGKLDRGIRKWAATEFGAENLVSLDLHTDESTPHFHLIVTPIRDGKLQAKVWLNGAGSLASLRKRAHAVISRYVPCEYQPGRPGGQPHDARKAAGNGPVPGFFGKVLGYKRLANENDQLRVKVRELEQRVFSRRKLTVKTAMVKNVEEAAQKLAGREKALEGRQGAILAKERALEAETGRARGVLERYSKDAAFYEQEATRLLVENERLKSELDEERKRADSLADRLAEHEPRRGMRPGGSSFEPD